MGACVALAHGRETDAYGEDVLGTVELAHGDAACRADAGIEGADAFEADGVRVAQLASHHFEKLFEDGLDVGLLHRAVALDLGGELVGAIAGGADNLGVPLTVGLGVLLVHVLRKSVKYWHNDN